jgi:hypothetical protein
MISLPKHSWILAAGFLGCVACGGGGGDGVGSDVVRLAGGRRIPEGNDGQLRSLLLRSVDGEWQSVGEGVLREQIVGIVFASADEAWAWGPFSASRSRDAGRTWEDAWATLPAEFQTGTHGIQRFAFADAMVGYLAGYKVGFATETKETEGPYVWRTTDGGATWSAVDGLTAEPVGTFSKLGLRGSVGEILRGTATSGTLVQRFENAVLDVQTVSVASVAADDLTSAGERAWVGLSEYPSETGGARPLILRSDAPGGPWIPQTLPNAPSHNLALDFCDRNLGIAGAGLAVDETPIVFWTDDGGEQWGLTVLEDLAGAFAEDVLCVGPREMWLVANDDRAHLVRSRDGGRSFDPVELGVDGRHRVHALASNGEFLAR